MRVGSPLRSVFSLWLSSAWPRTATSARWKSRLVESRAMFTCCKARAEMAQALHGKTLDQIKQAKILDQCKKYAGEFVNQDAYLGTLYNSLTGQKTGKFVKHN